MTSVGRRDARLPSDKMSSIMDGDVKQQRDIGEMPKLMDTEADTKKCTAEIKNLLKKPMASGKPVTFDDLTAMMGKSKF